MAFRADDYITVTGPRWRVKLSISDYSESAIESQKLIPTSFWIQIIPAHWPKSASFGSYGACQKKFTFHDMVAHAESLSGQKIRVPRRWEKYALSKLEQQKSTVDCLQCGKPVVYTSGTCPHCGYVEFKDVARPDPGERTQK